MKDAILILGAAALQVPLIRYVQSRGYRTVVVSIKGNYPGFDIADRCIYCDVRDGDAILSMIGEETICAVITDQTDLSVPTVAYLSNRLGLKSNKIETATIYSNKYLIRQVCDRLGICNPCYARLCTVDDAKSWHCFPAVIKPEDSQGSRGVCCVKSSKELLAAYESAVSFSKSGHAIVEEFCFGDEVVVEGFVHKGEYINWGIGDRKYFVLNKLFIPSQTIFPSTLGSDLINKLLETEKLIHSYLRPSSGMIHSEYLVNKNTGDIRLVETALRGGGVYISSHLVPLYCGIDNYKILLDSALGIGIDLHGIHESMHQKASAYICFYLPEGRIVSIDGAEDLGKMEGVVMSDIENLHVGTRIKRMTDKTQRLGPIIVTAENRADIDALISRVQNTIRIEVQCPSGKIEGIKWM